MGKEMVILMAKTGEQRGAKYEAKLDADVVAKRITAQRQAMIDSNKVEQVLMASRTDSLRAIFNTRSLDPLDFVKYNAVVMALYRLSKSYATAPNVRITQSKLLLNYYLARGLSSAVLGDIAIIYDMSWP